MAESLQIMVLLLMLISAFFVKPMGSNASNDVVPPVRTEPNKLEDDYYVKAEFHIVSSPEEILKTLVDWKSRSKWDYDLNLAQADLFKNELHLEYVNDRGEVLQENIKIKYIVESQHFYIIENITSPTIGQYDRLWIIEPIKNR